MYTRYLTVKRKYTFNIFILLCVGILLTGCGSLYMRDIANSTLDPNNLSDTEPSIAVNPINTSEIAIVAFSENWSATRGAPVWKSSDRGLTWRKIFQIPRPSSTIGPGDQKIDYDASGNLYIAELAIGPTFIENYVYRQTGAADAALTPGASYGYDQPHLSVDSSNTSSRQGDLYSPWLDFSGSKPRSTVDSSTDKGVTMNTAGAGDNSTYSNRTTRVAIAPDGKVYIVYKTREGNAGVPAGFERAHFRVNRSDDGGATWNALGVSGVSVHGATQVQTYFTNNFGNPAKGKVARARSSDTWIATHPKNGNVYVAYVSRDSSGFAQIYVARSVDQGVNWTQSRATDGAHNSAFPEIAITKRGVIGVLYVDYDDSGTATLFRHRFVRSFNNGITWRDRILQEMNPTPIANAQSGFLWGDYEGLTAVKNTFYGVFTGESSFRIVKQLDPIFFRQKSCRWWWLSCWFESE